MSPQESSERTYESGFPDSLTFVRHAESKYNSLKKRVAQVPSFNEFKQAFKAAYYADPNKRVPRDDLDVEVLDGKWPTPELRELAVAFYKDIKRIMQGVSDFDTPLTERGLEQARETGKHIAEHIPTPDRIYVSPYVRTHQTLDGILQHAPADWKNIPCYEYEALREQEHGIQCLTNDWRINFVLEPMEMLHFLKQGSYSYRYPGGESRSDVRTRVNRFIGRMHRRHSHENILAVSHHLTILAAIAEFRHWTREQFIEWDEHNKPPNGSLTIFRRHELGSGKPGGKLVLADEDYGKVLYTT